MVLLECLPESFDYSDTDWHIVVVVATCIVVVKVVDAVVVVAVAVVVELTNANKSKVSEFY
jgi:hypothetical protein